MPSRYLDANAAARAHIATLYVVIVFLMLGCIGLWYGWKEAPRDIRISIPPDLRAGAIVRPDEYQAAQVFAFASLYHQALNRWEEDGARDFAKRIEELQAYVTPAYRDELIESMHQKMRDGELKGRTRYALTLEPYAEYQAEYVTTVNRDRWVVDLEVEIVEQVAGLEAKRVKIHYPISVVRINIDPARNIWGLALDGTPHDQAPWRIDPGEGSA